MCAGTHVHMWAHTEHRVRLEEGGPKGCHLCSIPPTGRTGHSGTKVTPSPGFGEDTTAGPTSKSKSPAQCHVHHWEVPRVSFPTDNPSTQKTLVHPLQSESRNSRETEKLPSEGI